MMSSLKCVLEETGGSDSLATDVTHLEGVSGATMDVSSCSMPRRSSLGELFKLVVLIAQHFGALPSELQRTK